jgi:signal transduction histidine kinase
MNKDEGESGWMSNPPKGTILIVDDEPANLTVVADHLANAGFSVKVARTGERGLELARQFPPDLILLDVLLPGIDGFEACRRLKADGRTRAVPVIFMTIVTTVEEKIKGFDVGGVDYITKPFQRAEVLARVTTHLTLHRLQQELRELNLALEEKVALRTKELTTANQRLQQEVSERKQAEAEVQRLNRELEQRVMDRTAQLKAANQELEAFAYSVSHDLRAPLRHIDGFLELLQKTCGTTLTDQGRHYMDNIYDATNKMGLMIDDLLTFSRMRRHDISFKPVELGPLVREVIGELAPDVAGRKIEWCIGDLPLVDGDATMLRMVMANLIANAIKFTRLRQKAQIEIGSQCGQNAETVIFVRDNGVGFDMTYGDKLFGVFQRLHRADEFEGTGIGLASVHRIITRHRGRTWAEGEVDQGATFFFSLPSKPKKADDDGS